jgi:hypothetical protein
MADFDWSLDASVSMAMTETVSTVQTLMNARVIMSVRRTLTRDSVRTRREVIPVDVIQATV